MTQQTQPLWFKLLSKDTQTKNGTEILYGWFMITEQGHQKNGLQFAIPIKHPDYTNELQQTLTQLSIGDTIQMKLQSLNEKNTAWKCISITEL